MNAGLLLKHFAKIIEAPEAVPLLRRFILDLAVRGKLVPQDENDEPAEKLLERIKLEKEKLVKDGKLRKFEPLEKVASIDFEFSLPEKWQFTTLQSICTSVTDGDHLPPPKAKNGIPLLVIGNVRTKSINFDNCRYVEKEYYEALDVIRRPTTGDLLYTLVGSYGIPIKVLDSREFCVQRHIGILRPSKHIDLGFLAYLMESKQIFDQAERYATGIAQKTVSLSGLRKIIVPLPPLEEQRRIVAKVSELMTLCDTLENASKTRETLQDQLNASSLHFINQENVSPEETQLILAQLPRMTARKTQVKALRQIILDLAIQGKLAPENKSDESSNVVLEKIKLEKDRLVKAGEIREGKKVNEIQDEEIPKKYLGTATFVRLATIAALKKGLTGIQSAQAGEYPLVVTAQERATCDHFDFDGTAALIPMVSSSGHGDASLKRLHYQEGKFALGNILCAVFPILPDVISARFIFEYLTANKEELLVSRMVGTANVSLTLEKIGEVPIPIVSIQNQARVHELMTLCDTLETELYNQELGQQQLLEAVLHHALTPSLD